MRNVCRNFPSIHLPVVIIIPFRFLLFLNEIKIWDILNNSYAANFVVPLTVIFLTRFENV